MKNRGVATVIILTIITCGIYGWYWLWVTNEALVAEGGKSTVPSIAILLLAIFVGPIGYLLFAMDADANINEAKAKAGVPTVDNKVLWMILGFIIPIVAIGLIQNEINKLAQQ